MTVLSHSSYYDPLITTITPITDTPITTPDDEDDGINSEIYMTASQLEHWASFPRNDAVHDDECGDMYGDSDLDDNPFFTEEEAHLGRARRLCPSAHCVGRPTF